MCRVDMSTCILLVELFISLISAQVYLQDQALGCDGVIGSGLKIDGCGVCGGRQSTCNIISGIFTKRTRGAKYEVITEIPVGAVQINITEGRNTRNYLALRYAGSKVGILNSNWTLDWSGQYKAAGTILKYMKPRHSGTGETITMPGPITSAVELLLLAQTTNPGIYYQYGLPLPNQFQNSPFTNNRYYGAPPGTSNLRYQSDSAGYQALTGSRRYSSSFDWKQLTYSQCSEPCGEGYQESEIVCVQLSSQAKVTDENCDFRKKPTERKIRCNTHLCKPRWVEGEWSECSSTCGQSVQTRQIECKQRISASRDISVYAAQCKAGDKPSIVQVCQLENCHTWSATNWTECSAKCGAGTRSRQIHCIGPSGRRVNSTLCDFDKPRHHEKCYSSCEKAWYVSEWSNECRETCGSKNQTRQAYCPADRDGRASTSLCGRQPVTEQTCETTEACTTVGTWFTSEWSICIGDCDKASQRRSVICMKKRGEWFRVTYDIDCVSEEKPIATQKCQPAACSSSEGRWFTTDWTECSTSCGEGYQKRDIKCLDAGLNERTDCNESIKPQGVKSCPYTECPEPEIKETESDCQDQYSSCVVVVQARLCRLSYYRKLCCNSCHGEI